MNNAFSTFGRVILCGACIMPISRPVCSDPFNGPGLAAFATGLDMPSGFSDTNRRLERPLDLASEQGSSIGFSAVAHETVRSISGADKNILSGRGTFSATFMERTGKQGVTAIWSHRYGSLSWPFYHGSAAVNEDMRIDDFAVAGFLRTGNSANIGASLGHSSGGGVFAALEAGGSLYGVAWDLGWSRMPSEWGFDIVTDSDTERLGARYTTDRFHAGTSCTIPAVAVIGLKLEDGRAYTPDSFRDGRHRQVWDYDWRRYGITVEERALPRVRISFGYDRDGIEGGLDWRHNGSGYMQSVCDIDSDRYRLTVAAEDAADYIPALSLHRTKASLGLSNGRLDSWPFTSAEMQVLGDKTWTFSGDGSLVCGGATFDWERLNSFHAALSLFRAWPDYEILVVTRDHLSLNPWDMLFGRRRIERDSTRYYDFGVFRFGKTLETGMWTTEISLLQLFPLRHVRSGTGGKAPEPPAISDISLKMPERYGGLSLRVEVKRKL